MVFLAISSGAFAFLFLLILFSKPLRVLGARERRLRRIAESNSTYFDELSGSFIERFILPVIEKVRRRFFRRRALPQGQTGAKNAKLEKQLRAAGIHIGADAYTAFKLAIFFVAAIGSLVLALRVPLQPILKLLIVAFVMMLSVFIPIYALRFITKVRQESIRNQLPDMLDILSVNIDAGLSFDMALKRALDRFTGALREELMYTSMEMQTGKPRRIALAELGERNDIAELNILAAAIVQSEQMGTPIKNVLKVQSAKLRTTRRQAAQEKGMKAPVKMLLPMVAFVFPVLFIVLMGPAVVNMIDMFK